MPAVTEETSYRLCIEVINGIIVINGNNDTEYNEDYRTVNLRQPLSENGPFSLKGTIARESICIKKNSGLVENTPREDGKLLLVYYPYALKYCLRILQILYV
jgi:hypothetical protein